ncbi:MAG: response regulator [Deltaproteobacteria bacterium]|nr:response regulator [Deltaproteobacteria bacterium]
MGVVRVLIVDDNEDDAELILRELRRHGIEPSWKHATNADELRALLTEPWDVVLSDWSMPRFDGLAAFRIVREVDADVPFIISSGTIDEEIAVTALKAGVHDFVNKNKLTRLVPAIQREMREAEVRRTRKKTEAEVARQRELVQRSEDRYRAMFDSSPLPMWTYDRETLRFVAVNDAAVRHYGYTRDELLGMTLADIRPAADLEALRQDVERSRGISAHQVWRHRKKDGSLIAVEVTANDIVIDGRPLRLALINDVTERERPMQRPLSLWIALGALVAAALLSVIGTNRLVRAMDRFDHTHRLIEGLDAVDRGYHESNAGLTRSGLEAVRGEFPHDLTPDDSAQLAHVDELSAALEQRSGPDVERVIGLIRDHATGRLEEERNRIAAQVMFERIAQLVATLGSVVILWLVFSRLLREARLRRVAEDLARQNEEAIATMLHSIGDGVIATDVEGRVIRVNRVAEQLTGWTTSEALGRPFEDVLQLTEDSVLVSRSGAATPVAHSEAPILDAHNEVAGSIVVFHDASVERRHAETMRTLNEDLERRVVERTEALRKTEEQLRQSQKIEAIGRLAGGIAHDFNNLLTVIISFSDLMIEDAASGALPAHVVADLDEIKKAGLRAADLTRQLLAFSRQQVLEPKVTDLNDIVAGMEKLLRRVIGADITLRTVKSTDSAKAFVDPGQMEQVLMNLVVNARDAMPRGGKLTIEVSRVELDETFTASHHGLSPGSYVQLAVTDTGSGMSKEVQSQIFEPFFTTKEKGKGTGLGLSTVFGIVRQSGGTIWVYSEVGTGTTFKIYLPLTHEARAQPEVAMPAKRFRGSETILLVEDEPQVRAVARGILTRAGYTVLEAENGPTALALCEQAKQAIELVLTDVVMPGMSGRELVERLLKIRPDAKILFMSGYTDDTVVHHGVLDQGIAYLQKPLTPDALTRKVREVLDGKA